ncbi:membrane protein [Stenotrophomonas humi]|uniref:Membrane protein n=1 Tax=Stenotrophomonas humi TaxID=405444 RepID=A0A0R0C2S1_9GAMM|nr:MMPL family transporter [Stenotrophomonas humi]KRG63606.1 membrane protein [Stenotrophomonas humi]
MPCGWLALKLSSGRRIGLAIGWLLLLGLLTAWLSARMQVSGDLRKFMPDARTPAQKLLLDELGEGPGARLLLIALSGAAPEQLAVQSHGLREALAADAQFELVANGEQAGLEAFPERLLPYRYLIDALPDDAFSSATLREELQARVQDLGSPAGGLIEPLLASDPTLQVLRVAESLQPASAPQRIDDVWFDSTGKQALLLVQTRAAGFDPGAQQQAVDAIHGGFDALSGESGSRIELSGPGAFSVKIGNRTASEASTIGMLDTLGMILLLWFAYRSWKMPILGFLPLASAGLAGLTAVVIGFDGVHGITIAFGFTLIGVVQDYPIHFFSHERPGRSPWDNVRALWPTLGTGVIATCIAYLTFLFSGVEGLKQLSVFTITALATAALATRYLLPALVDPATRDLADSSRLAWLWRHTQRLPRPRGSLLVLAIVALAVLLWAPGPFWQNDLSRLTPVDPQDLMRDAELRGELGAPDVRYVISMQGTDAQAVLAASERLRPALDTLVASGALERYDMAARYLPSAGLQRKRQQQLPDESTLRATVADAVADTPFRSDAFEPFIADVARARTAPVLQPEDLQGTPLATAVEGLLLQGKDHSTAVVSLSGLRDVAAVAATARTHGAELLDLKHASESLVADYRGRVLSALLVAVLLLSLTVWATLRSPRRVARVLLPMALTTLLVLAVLRGAGVELNLFHLIGLILAAGLGLDYGLFFEHAGDSQADQLRTLHGLLVCSVMTLLVFSLLGLSSIPVLRAIGSTVALGVVCNFVLALLISRHPMREAGDARA